MAGQEEEAGMAQMGGDIGIVMDSLKAMGEGANTFGLLLPPFWLLIFTCRPDGGLETPFAQSKGTIM